MLLDNKSTREGHEVNELNVKARIIKNYEHKGHMWVVLDAMVVANETMPLIRAIAHRDLSAAAGRRSGAGHRAAQTPRPLRRSPSRRKLITHANPENTAPADKRRPQLPRWCPWLKPKISATSTPPMYSDRSVGRSSAGRRAAACGSAGRRRSAPGCSATGKNRSRRGRTTSSAIRHCSTNRRLWRQSEQHQQQARREDGQAQSAKQSGRVFMRKVDRQWATRRRRRRAQG